MNTFLSRANTIFAFTLSVMAALTFGCFLTTAFNEHKAPVVIKTAKAMVKNVPDYTAGKEKSDLGFITFDLQADLNPLFNWNVKQLFLYLTAEYTTPNNKINQVVLWDKIIKRGDNAVLDYRSMNTKYYFWDDGHGLKGNSDVRLRLHWNIIPVSGLLPLLFTDDYTSVAFPTEYSK